LKKNHDARAAHKKLDAIPSQIKRVVAEMRKNEEHGKIWETHKHTLHRKLNEVRKYIEEHSKKVTHKNN